MTLKELVEKAINNFKYAVNDIKPEDWINDGVKLPMHFYMCMDSNCFYLYKEPATPERKYTQGLDEVASGEFFDVFHAYITNYLIECCFIVSTDDENACHDEWRKNNTVEKELEEAMRVRAEDCRASDADNCFMCLLYKSDMCPQEEMSHFDGAM